MSLIRLLFMGKVHRKTGRFCIAGWCKGSSKASASDSWNSSNDWNEFIKCKVGEES